MRPHCGIVVVSLIVVFGGNAVRGQDRQRPAEKGKKPVAAAKSDAGKKPVAAAKSDAGKKPVAAVKSDAGKKPAQTGNPAQDPDEKLIRASADAFTKLYNAHDSKGLAALFAPKAEMIDENDNVVKGREAIQSEFEEVFKSQPKASMQVDVESVRVLTPQLAIEEGTARSQASADDPEDVTTYVAIHAKIDGKWLLVCVRDWYAPSAELTPHDHLEQDLSWLLGEWIDESPDSTVHTACKWHDNGNFLMQEFHVVLRGEVLMSGTMRIGWNAVTKQFQSWVFDSHGGHSTGFWFRDGDRWIVKMQGATASGEAGSSTFAYLPVDNDTIAWTSYDRVVDGERQDDIDQVIVKRRPPPPPAE